MIVNLKAPTAIRVRDMRKIKKMPTAKKIETEADYKSVMARIDNLMSKGSENVSKTELAEILKLAITAQEYEKTKFTIAAPTTLPGIIEIKMFEMCLEQKDLALQLKARVTKI